MFNAVDETEEDFHIRVKKIKVAHRLLDFLDIPYANTYDGNDHMSVLDLYNILMDEKKLQAIVSKLNLKAFW